MRLIGAGMERKERAERIFEPEAWEPFTSSPLGGMAESPRPLSSGDIGADSFDIGLLCLFSSPFS